VDPEGWTCTGIGIVGGITIVLAGTSGLLLTAPGALPLRPEGTPTSGAGGVVLMMAAGEVICLDAASSRRTGASAHAVPVSRLRPITTPKTRR
jgi:hypothetical protein